MRGFEHSLYAADKHGGAILAERGSEAKHLIEFAQVSFSTRTDESVRTEAINKLLNDLAVGSNVVRVLIVFVARSDLKIAAIDVECFLRRSWFGVNFSAFCSVYVIHSLTQMFFSFGLGDESFLAESNTLVPTYIAVECLSFRPAILVEILHSDFLPRFVSVDSRLRVLRVLLLLPANY
ncbi:MAG TPA: hypothetical protein VK582_17650 [Pyrinomonadaceae bacterium]|nr:hypothetical protein [Pyrinomonadaceae bacterium]